MKIHDDNILVLLQRLATIGNPSNKRSALSAVDTAIVQQIKASFKQKTGKTWPLRWSQSGPIRPGSLVTAPSNVSDVTSEQLNALIDAIAESDLMIG